VARIDTRKSSRYWRNHRVLGPSCLLADFTAHDYVPHSHDALALVATEVDGSEFKSWGRTDEVMCAGGGTGQSEANRVGGILCSA